MLFIGAGMSAESGVPTYRGAGGIWSQYRYQDDACQRAFERDPAGVLDFHELRRGKVLGCAPHAGHHALAKLQARRGDAVAVITQNIDGLLQRAGLRVDVELHGSLWRLRCACGRRDDPGNAATASGAYARRRCEHCGDWLRPDITWFEDGVDETVFARAAGLVRQARGTGARMIEINPEETEISGLFDEHVRQRASTGLSSI